MTLIEHYRSNECQQLLTAAHEKTSMLLHKAFHKAREYVHETIVSERQRSAEHIHVAQAELKTQKRKHTQQADAMILKLGRQAIRQQLLTNWHNNSTRQIWLKNAVNSALKHLPHGDWWIHHPLDWSDEESQLAIDITHLHKVQLFFQPDAAIKSGIRIEAAATVLDMTDQGLLADEQRLQARLLALFHQVSSS